MLSQYIAWSGRLRVSIQIALTHGVQCCHTLDNLKAIGRYNQRLRGCVIAVICAPDPLHQPLHVLRRADLDYQIHVPPVYAKVQRACAHNGAQGAVCSGGRYDGLFEQLGGKPVPAIGWAIGVERLLALCEEEGADISVPAADLYLIAEPNSECEQHVLELSESLRDSQPGIRVLRHMGGGSMKSQLKRADKSGAAWALIVGQRELDGGMVSL